MEIKKVGWGNLECGDKMFLCLLTPVKKTFWCGFEGKVSALGSQTS